MKKIILTTALLIIIISQSTAQKYHDILYLKNGNKVFGSLQEVSDNQYKIKVNDSTYFTFKVSEVEKFTKATETGNGRKENGLGFSIEAGFLVGAQSNTYDKPFSFNTILNYTADRANVFGLGTGAEFLGKNYTPFFIEYKRLLHEKGVTPYLFVRAGTMAYFGSNDKTTYSYSQYYLRKNYSGGGSFTLGAGISWAGDGFETNLSFAYRYARTSYLQSEYNQPDVTYKTNYNRLEIKLGFRF